MGFGLLWAVLFLVIGAMTLSGSNGNPQNELLELLHYLLPQ